MDFTPLLAIGVVLSAGSFLWMLINPSGEPWSLGDMDRDEFDLTKVIRYSRKVGR